MDQPDRIHLRDYLVAAEIGAFQTERGHPQRLRFDIEVELATHVVGVNDEVDRILSYDILTGAVAVGLADRRYALLETLAERIAAQVLYHPRAAQVVITVEKLDRLPSALGVTLVRRQARVEAPEIGPPILALVHCPALILAQWERCDWEVTQRQKVGASYTAMLNAECPGVTTPYIEPHNTSVFAQYSVLIADRDGVARHLGERGIPTAVHYPVPLNRQPAYIDLCGGRSTPISDEIAARVISLPMGPDLGLADQQRIVSALKSAFL